MIVRYLSKEKFEWLLRDGGVYVGAASNQSDKNEGVYDSGWMSKVFSGTVGNFGEMLWRELDKVSEGLMCANRDCCYISSWRIGDSETREMWDEYGGNGVALVSDESLLVQGLPGSLRHASSFYKVVYSGDQKRSAVDESLRFKEEKYQHESEFRLVVDMRKYSILTGFDKGRFGELRVGGVPSYECKSITCCMSSEDIEQSHRVIAKKDKGYVLKYNLQEIIREVRLHPSCTDQDVLHVAERLESFQLEDSVRRSSLSK